MMKNAKVNLTFFLSRVRSEAGRDVLRFKEQVEMFCHKCWFDGCTTDKSIQMEDELKNCDVVIVFVTKNYFHRKVCIQELTWAMKHGKKVQPVHLARHKHKIGDWRNSSPERFQWLFERNILSIDVTDPSLFFTTLPGILNDTMEATTAPPLLKDIESQQTLPISPNINTPVMEYDTNVKWKKHKQCRLGFKYVKWMKCTPCRLGFTAVLLVAAIMAHVLVVYQNRSTESCDTGPSASLIPSFVPSSTPNLPSSKLSSVPSTVTQISTPTSLSQAGWIRGPRGESCTYACAVHDSTGAYSCAIESVNAVNSATKFQTANSFIADAGEYTPFPCTKGYTSDSDDGDFAPGTWGGRGDGRNDKCYFEGGDDSTCDDSYYTLERLCCCIRDRQLATDECPVTEIITPTVSPEPTALLETKPGWIRGPRGESCTYACAVHDSTGVYSCAIEQVNAVNSVTKFQTANSFIADVGEYSPFPCTRGYTSDTYYGDDAPGTWGGRGDGRNDKCLYEGGNDSTCDESSYALERLCCCIRDRKLATEECPL